MTMRFAVACALAATLSLTIFTSRACSDVRTPAARTPAEVKTRIHSILGTKDYEWQPDRESALGALARRGSDAVWRFFSKLRRRVDRSPSKPPSPLMTQIMFWAIFLGLVILLLTLLGLLVRAIWHGISHRTGREKKPRVAEIVETEDATSLDPNEWFALARQAADAGDFRRAYRAAFMAVLVALDRRGAIRWHRSRTNGDYLRDLRSAPELHVAVRPLAHLFDAVWYGHAPANRGDVDRCLEVAAACSAVAAQGGDR